MTFMQRRPLLSRAVAFGLTGLLLCTGAVQAAEVNVVSSGGFAAAYRTLGPAFETSTGNTLVTAWCPSMGNPATQCRPG